MTTRYPYTPLNPYQGPREAGERADLLLPGLGGKGHQATMLGLDQHGWQYRSPPLDTSSHAAIYTDRETTLLVAPTDKGILKVNPRVSGDASTGVRSVETFMLDIVCLISAIKSSRAPRILVHDSHLFDAVDGRQVASCLNIGARLAEQHGFQYIVTLNSDDIESVEARSDGAFDAEPYIISTRLTDATEEGGLFGFRFD